ncbi:hypothetical protein ACHAXR_010208 [Thalassiosira sp. AJA248-18]
MATLGRKASEAAAKSYEAATALANPFTRRIAEAIANATAKDGKSGSSMRRKSSGGGDNNDDGDTRCTDPGAPFGFLDNMCGPMLRNFNGDLGGSSNDADDLTEAGGRGRSGRGASGSGGRGTGGVRGGERRRPTGSYDYGDDETNATDITGSYEDDDETYDDDSRRKGRGDKRRGRDRKPRGRSPIESPSEMTGYSEFDDDTTQNDTVTDVSSAYDKHRDSSGKHSSSHKSKRKPDDDAEKLITQPLASGFAKRCYFTKAGIGRTTQHYEGLTLTGNTVLMLAAAMKLKGCPTICDEDLRRVEQTYPNQFSRLPDELLLSSGWRRISKYCHFSHKPLPDGVPFFHSRKRCHPNGGFYFLLCSAVGMTRLMDVEPLNRDALVVLQTDFPMTCDKAPKFLMEDQKEWTLVNKFCFFSGGPINVEEDVYYRAELGGTEIYMLAFLSPSLSPEELYRLKPAGQGHGQQQEDTGPLKSVGAVEEVESVYDLTERDFDDLKLYHLGPCRALPPYLLHPETWTKVLPPHFVAAREEALSIAMEWESRFPQPSGSHSLAGSQIPASQSEGGGANMMGESPGSSGYVELGGGGGRPPPSARGGMPPAGQGYPPQYPGHGMQTPMNHQQDPNAPFYPPGGMDQAGFPQQQHQQQPYGAPPTPMESEMNYYYGASPPAGMMPPAGPATPQFQQHNMPPPSATDPYGNPNMGAPSHDMMSVGPMNPMGGPPPFDAGPHQQPYGNAPPQHMMGDPHWVDVREEGAFGMVGGDQPDDEAIATRGGMYGGPGGPGMGGYPMGGPMDQMEPMDQMGPMDQMEPMGPDDQFEDQFGRSREDPPDFNNIPKSPYDGQSVASGASSLMGGAQDRLKQNRMKKMNERTPRPDLSTKLGGNSTTAPGSLRPDLSTKLGGNNTTVTPGAGDDSTWDTQTDGESSYGTSLASSSAYTDTTNPNERNSRRALILQMAKARMKNVKEQSSTQNADAPAQQGQEGEDVNNNGASLEMPQDELVDEVAGLELD